MLLFLFGLVGSADRRQRRELDEAKRFVASLDAFCREWCIDQAGDDRHQGDGDGYDGWLPVEDRYQEDQP